jgi:DNA repair ATPase RecN
MSLEELYDSMDFNESNENNEKKILAICKSFSEKWKGFTNEQLLSDEYKETYFYDSEKVFSLLEKHFGSQETLKELEKIIKEEPDSLDEANDYLEFLENIKTVKNIRQYEDELIDPNCIFSKKMKNCLLYLEKKQDDLDALTKTVGDLNQSLEKLAQSLKELSKNNE